MAVAKQKTRRETGERPIEAPSTGQGRAEALVAVALDLFAARNFATVTIKDIGREAGANSALIYYYFKDKEDLFRACIESAVEQAFERFRVLHETNDSPADVINDWLDMHIDVSDIVRKMVKVSVDYKNLEGSQPSVDAAIMRFYDGEAAIIESCLREGAEREDFRAVDPQAMAMMISTFLDGVMVRSIIIDDFDLAASIKAFRQHLWVLLDYSPPS